MNALTWIMKVENKIARVQFLCENPKTSRGSPLKGLDPVFKGYVFRTLFPFTAHKDFRLGEQARTCTNVTELARDVCESRTVFFIYFFTS